MKEKKASYFCLLIFILTMVSCGKKSADVPEGSKEISVEDEDIKMVLIHPGTFTMGGTFDQAPCDYFRETPTHKVTITKPYFISQTEVTQELWMTVMGNNPSLYKGQDEEDDDDFPVANVSWDDCQQFIKRLNTMTGKKFRLPTEAEWEYAARGAGNGYNLAYAGSKFPDRVACMNLNSGGHPHPVAQYGENEVGLYDMCGNVWEWVQDNYQRYDSADAKDPCITTSDTLSHVVRGGSFLDNRGNVRIAVRDEQWPKYKQTNLGFRLAMDVTCE